MPKGLLNDIGRDARQALRQLLRRPGFAAVALVTLALGIGAPTAIFSVVYAVLVRPLPYPEPDRIVRFRIESRSPMGTAAFDALPASTALQWEAQSSTLSAMALFNDRSLTLSTAEGPFRLIGLSATPNLFELLGVQPLIGRTFGAGSRDARAVVLSHATWQRYFAGDPAVVGTAVTFDGEQYRVSGVMPPDFGFPSPDAAFWVPLVIAPGEGRGMVLPAIARLRPDVTVAGALDEGRRWLAEAGDARVEQTLFARTLQEQLTGDVRRVLWILMGAVALVSAIATTNIALLLLTRGASRSRELSIRIALGAGSRRLLRQLFVEALLLAAAGGLAGLALARGLLTVLLRLAPASLPRLQEATLGVEVLTFAIGVTFATSMIFGVLSAGRTLAIDPVRALGGAMSDAPSVGGPGRRRRVNVLAAAEVALTMVLLVGAGLLLRSFVQQVMTPQGFDSRGALASQITLPASRYPTPAARLAFHERLLARLQEVPQISSAGVITMMPNRQPSARNDFNPNGPRVPDPFSMQVAEVRSASEGFIEAMGIPLIAGRTFRREDAEGAEPVMIVSESLARLHFGDADPIGRTLYSGVGNRQVVGVVADVRRISEGAPVAPSAYFPVRQDSGVFRWFAGVTVVTRSRNPSAMIPIVRGIVRSLDPEMPPFNVRTLDDEVWRLTAAPRFSASVLASFAAIALILAAIGIYGVMAYAVAQRTREIGVRAALGATRRQLAGLIARDCALVVGSGVAAGLLASLWLAQTLTGILHEVHPADPTALVTVGLLLSAVGLFAGYLPARRAMRVNPVEALRAE